MRHVLALAKRELVGYFLSPVGYIVAFCFIGMYTLFFYLVFSQSTDANEVLQAGIEAVGTLAMFVVPFFTMGLLADERRTGTIEMLMTAPVADWEVVAGKYLGSVVFVLLMIVPSFAQVLAVRQYGLPEWGPVISGYVGLLLLVLFLISMGLFFSSVSKSSLVAVILSFGAVLVLLLLGSLVRDMTPAVETANLFKNLLYYLKAVLRYAAIVEHYMSFAFGLINSRDVVYFASGTAFFLFLSTLAVESRKWK